MFSRFHAWCLVFLDGRSLLSTHGGGQRVMEFILATCQGTTWSIRANPHGLTTYQRPYLPPHIWFQHLNFEETSHKTGKETVAVPVLDVTVLSLFLLAQLLSFPFRYSEILPDSILFKEWVKSS